MSNDPVGPSPRSHSAVSKSPSHWSSVEWLLWGFALIAGALLLWWQGPELWQMVQDEQALAEWIARLGWWGPVMLIGVNAAQIVIAPIPGYVMQIAAGFLYGAWWGGLYGAVGLLLGSSLAFGLARRYGRPSAARFVGAERLDRWERVTHSTSTLVWFVLLLGPTGDLPYFLAGLARVSYFKILIITLFVRVPSAFVVAATGAGVVALNWWQLLLIFGGLFTMLFVFLRYQDALVNRADRFVARQLQRVEQEKA